MTINTAVQEHALLKKARSIYCCSDPYGGGGMKVAGSIWRAGGSTSAFQFLARVEYGTLVEGCRLSLWAVVVWDS